MAGDSITTQSQQDPAEFLPALMYLKRFNVDAVVGNMLYDILLEEPAQPLPKMIEWLQDYVAKEAEKLEAEQHQLDVASQAFAVIDAVVAVHKTREQHAVFLGNLSSKLKELPQYLHSGRYNEIAAEAHHVHQQSLGYGYVRLRHFMLKIIESCTQCQLSETRSCLPPHYLRHLRALLGCVVYHLTMLQIEVESLFDDNAD